MNCEWINSNDAVLVCSQCRRPLLLSKRSPVPGVARQCRAKVGRKSRASSIPKHGIGTELTKLLAEASFFDAPGCQCKSAAAQMDARGIAWCEEQTDWIRGVLKTEHDRQKLDVWDEDIVRGFLIPEAIRRAKDDPNAKP